MAIPKSTTVFVRHAKNGVVTTERYVFMRFDQKIGDLMCMNRRAIGTCVYDGNRYKVEWEGCDGVPLTFDVVFDEDEDAEGKVVGDMFAVAEWIRHDTAKVVSCKMDLLKMMQKD